MIEELDDIIEQLASDLGVWGSHNDANCSDARPCRQCWTMDLKQRIDAAVNVGVRLAYEDLPARVPSDASGGKNEA